MTGSQIFVITIKNYQRYLSILKPQTCRFYPTCSQYSIDAFEKFGVIKGIVKTVLRIFKCHPFHPGGYDPVK
ncbi:MAG: membrane protein insertion efficiency factor YidD [Nitrospirae bacterium]|nr:membrane protein insertion efficiency factor YidD [Nitrospirota bacterium]